MLRVVPLAPAEAAVLFMGILAVSSKVCGYGPDTFDIGTEAH